jgi:hypothetical protein
MHISGVSSGFHSLKEPATNTFLAAGLISSNETRFALGKAVFGTSALTASVVGAVLFTVATFVFFLVLIIDTNKTICSRKRSTSSIDSPRREQWACRLGQPCFATLNSLSKRSNIGRKILFPRTGRLASFLQNGQRASPSTGRGIRRSA